MTIAERLATYKERGFQPETAAINVLLEEALQIIVSNFPDFFVFFGGASLVLFYGSPRHSGDLDLLTNHETPPSADELVKVLEQPLSATAEILGFPNLKIEPARATGQFLKLAVKSGERFLFTIDLTKIGSVIKSELVNFKIASDLSEPITVTVPSPNLLLLFKAETFLSRPFLKARDAFDIKLLRDSGASLDINLRAHLQDGSAAEKLEDAESIAKRIDRVNSKTCKAELEAYLPKALYQNLEKADFEPLRQALRELFSEWL